MKSLSKLCAPYQLKPVKSIILYGKTNSYLHLLVYNIPSFNNPDKPLMFNLHPDS